MLSRAFFAKLRRRLKRGVLRSLVDLHAAIKRFLAETDASPKPFVWTANPDDIIAAVSQVLDQIHWDGSAKTDGMPDSTLRSLSLGLC